MYAYIYMCVCMYIMPAQMLNSFMYNITESNWNDINETATKYYMQIRL